jgi:glutamate carboxypeptidase
MRHGAILSFALALPGMLSAAPGERLSPVERKLAQSVDAHRDASMALLERVVNINSGTMNTAGVQEVGAVFRAELHGLGFRTRWVEGAGFGRAGHLVAERPVVAGSPTLRVLLIGHLDTVFEKDSPFQRFERIDGTRARGPATTDMKGGNVVMLLALRALHDAGVLDRMDVRVYLGGDEEDSGAPLSASRAALLASAEGAEVAIGFEDGDGTFERAVIARRGVEEWRLRVTGKPAHSSLVLNEEIGAGAIYEIARILDAFRREVAPRAANVTFNPGMIVGGTAVEHSEQARGTAFGKTNVIAQTALATGDLRTLAPDQLEETRQRMQAIVARPIAHGTAELTFEPGYPPMAESEGNHRLLALLDEASRDLGLAPVGAVNPRQAGAADISFVATKVRMAIDGLGLKGSGGHTVEETADLSLLAPQAKRVAVLLARLADGRR